MLHATCYMMHATRSFNTLMLNVALALEALEKAPKGEKVRPMLAPKGGPSCLAGGSTAGGLGSISGGLGSISGGLGSSGALMPVATPGWLRANS